jgi:hypothetical protein
VSKKQLFEVSQTLLSLQDIPTPEKPTFTQSPFDNQVKKNQQTGLTYCWKQILYEITKSTQCMMVLNLRIE